MDEFDVQLEMQENLQNSITGYILSSKKDDYRTGYALADIICLHIRTRPTEFIQGFIDSMNGDLKYAKPVKKKKNKEYIATCPECHINSDIRFFLKCKKCGELTCDYCYNQRLMLCVRCEED